MGRVTKVESDAVVIKSDAAHTVSPLKAGDGIVFDAADWRSPEEREEGGRVYQVTALKNGQLRLHFANNAIDFAQCGSVTGFGAAMIPSWTKSAVHLQTPQRRPQTAGEGVRDCSCGGTPGR